MENRFKKRFSKLCCPIIHGHPTALMDTVLRQVEAQVKIYNFKLNIKIYQRNVKFKIQNSINSNSFNKFKLVEADSVISKSQPEKKNCSKSHLRKETVQPQFQNHREKHFRASTVTRQLTKTSKSEKIDKFKIIRNF